jgi:hypothetical protein
MWNQLVWWACIGLEALLLIRAGQTKLFRQFPAFYSYVCCVLLIDLLAIPLFKVSPGIYLSFYWSAEFLTAVLGYGVIVEIYNSSLINYPGVARFARILLLIIFLAVAAKVSVNLFSNSEIAFPRAIADLERSLRQMQAFLFCCLLVLFVYYKIPTNRNLRGLILGYALFIAVNVIAVTFIAHPATGFAVLMRHIEPFIYAISLIIWSATLWSRSPEPVLQNAPEIQKDYEYLARETRTMLLRARTHLMRATRQ